MTEPTAEQQRKLREWFDSQKVWDGGDAGELINLRARVVELEKDVNEYRKGLYQRGTELREASDFNLLLQSKLATVQSEARTLIAQVEMLREAGLRACDTLQHRGKTESQDAMFNRIVQGLMNLYMVINAVPAPKGNHQK